MGLEGVEDIHYTSTYRSPLGPMLLAADETGAVGLWFEGGRYYARCLDRENTARETPVIREVKRWLDVYFSGAEPDFTPPLHMVGTPFQLEVWTLLRHIPYGSTTTYRAIACQIAQSRGLKTMSAQAVGTAVGKNNLSLIIPCHRVLAANNSLAGYAGGIDKKVSLLKLEGAFREEYFIPRHTTAP